MRQPFSLTDEERQHLQVLVHRGKANARTLTRAWVLLKVDEGRTDADLVAAFDICPATVTTICKRYTAGGLEAALHDKRQQCRRHALTGQQTAHLIAVACSPSLSGHDHWTARLLAAKAVELGFVPSISPNTIHELLKKPNSNPGGMNIGACPLLEGRL